MKGLARTVDAIVAQEDLTGEVRKDELAFGDWILVTTAHSTYSIRVLQEGEYSVSGGWFDWKGLSPARIGIAGCTWGGRVIHPRLAAACGLHLEFGNRVVTSKIRRVRLLRAWGPHIQN